MRLYLLPTTRAPQEARQRLASLADVLDDDSYAAVKSVVSELVAFNVIHGASRPIVVSLQLEEGRIRGVVEDGPGVQAMVKANGLLDPPIAFRVIDALADEWGADDDQTRIFFRITVGKWPPRKEPAR